MSAILRRPSVAVATWSALVLGVFVWRGDLRLAASGGESSQEIAAADAARSGSEAAGQPERRQSGPVVVRRQDAGALPRTSRQGRVFDSMGFLLVGAEIVSVDQVARSNPSPARPAQASNKSDADGAFAVDLVAQRCTDLLVRASGRRSEWLRTSAISPDPLFVRLEPEAPWDGVPTLPEPAPLLRGEGMVVSPDGQPLAGAFVNVRGSNCWGVSDASGRVELPLPAGRATFLVSKSNGAGGGLAMISEAFEPSRTAGIVPMPRLVAEPAGSIRGIVRDARGEPVAGLPVEVRGAGARRHVQTQTGGVFVLSGLVPAEYEIEPFAYRGAAGEVTSLRVDRTIVACDLQLSQMQEADVRVVDERGEIAKGVWVAANLHGLRRGVDQVDDEGFVSLPVGANSEFDVRTADSHASCVVRQFDANSQPATLVIAQP